jgi:hypothetical protein
MSLIDKLGSGVGRIYVTQQNGTSIHVNLLNTVGGARQAKIFGDQSRIVSSGTSAIGSVVFTAPGSTSTFTGLTVDGVNQWAVGVTVVNPPNTTIELLAQACADAVNNFAPETDNYTAVAIGGTVLLCAPEGTGSSVNGDVVNLTFSATDATYTLNNMAGGTTSSGDVTDQRSGFRFFLNATESAAEGDLSGSDEVTIDMVPKDLRQSIDKEEVVVVGATGNCNVNRKSSITHITLDTDGGDVDMTTFTGASLQDGDLFIFTGKLISRETTIKSNVGNIRLASNLDFLATGVDNTIFCRYIGTALYEIARSTQQIATPTEYRAAGYPFPEEYGVGGLTMPSSGTKVLIADGSDERWEKSTNTVTLTGNVDVTVIDGSNVDGDYFYIELDGVITLDGFNLTVCGIPITKNQALTGGWCVYGYFDGTTEQAYLGISDPAKAQVEKDFIKPGDVDADIVSDDIKTDLITIPVSFETGELGDNMIRMPYKGSVINIFASVKKEIIANDGTITPKNNMGLTMTGGLLTITNPSAVDDTFQSTPSANNTFDEGEVLIFKTEKSTAGGKVLLSIKVQKSV